MSQEDAVLRHLKSGHTLTGLEALGLGLGMKLATKISTLRELGHDEILDEWVKIDGKRFKRYWIPKAFPQHDLFLSKDAAKQHEWAKE